MFCALDPFPLVGDLTCGRRIKVDWILFTEVAEGKFRSGTKKINFEEVISLRKVQEMR